MERSKKYDIHRLRRELCDLGEEIRALKKEIRTPHHNPTSQEMSRLRKMKLSATKLCCLRAHHRGKRHLSSVLSPAEDVYISELEPGYLLLKEVAA